MSIKAEQALLQCTIGIGACMRIQRWHSTLEQTNSYCHANVHMYVPSHKLLKIEESLVKVPPFTWLELSRNDAPFAVWTVPMWLDDPLPNIKWAPVLGGLTECCSWWVWICWLEQDGNPMAFSLIAANLSSPGGNKGERLGVVGWRNVGVACFGILGALLLARSSENLFSTSDKSCKKTCFGKIIHTKCVHVCIEAWTLAVYEEYPWHCVW